MQSLDNEGDSSKVDIFSYLKSSSTLVNRVSEEIEKSIEAGRIMPGVLLPSENELSRQFGVSRTVVREAIQGLVARHYLEVKPGNGTYVTSPTVESISSSMRLILRTGNVDADIRKILEVRRLLEVEIAGLAAERRTAADLDELANILKMQSKCCDDREDFSRLDVQFHNALADATHNELFSILVNSIADIMLDMRRLGYQAVGMQERSLKHHQAIYEQIRAGNRDNACLEMEYHLIEAEDIIRQAVDAQRDINAPDSEGR